LARPGVQHNPRLSPGSEGIHKGFPLSYQKKDKQKEKEKYSNKIITNKIMVNNITVNNNI